MAVKRVYQIETRLFRGDVLDEYKESEYLESMHIDGWMLHTILQGSSSDRYKYYFYKDVQSY